MAILDKGVGAATPPESEEQRAAARRKSERAAQPGNWLAAVLDHHRQIEAAFAVVRGVTDAAARVNAQEELALILTGHSIAEEAVLYPALVKAEEEGYSLKAYTEQSAAKVQMGLLESLAPMSADYLDKLDHLRDAVLHHMYEEEGTWFLDLKRKLPAADQVKLSARYLEAFSRYLPENEALWMESAGI